MRTFILFIFFFFFSFITFAQFADDFGDGEFILSPQWSGDVSNFIVTADAARQLQLQGDCASGGENYLSAAAPTNDTATWKFFVQLTFDPSSSNFTKIYLQSDNAALLGSLNGYYIRIGEDGSSDAVKLYRQDGLTSMLLLTGTEGEVATAPVAAIKVVRTTAGEWQLYVDPTGGTSYVAEGSVTDVTYTGGNYIGVYCKYTSTRCNDFYFDDFFVDPIYSDVDAPVISSVNVISSTQLEVLFNENVEQTSAETESNYSVDAGMGNPVNAMRDATDNKKVTLTFAEDFPSATLLTLSVNGVTDIAGNAIISEEVQFSFYSPQQFDVVIDEIMADPDPAVGLPAAEFIELYNTTDLDIDISFWHLEDATSLSDYFPPITIPADSFIIICNDADASLFTPYGIVLGINNFPSLNNDGDSLKLFDENMNLIHAVNYSGDWYQNTIKANGGYTLEMIDTNNPCQGINNWRASDDASGGTPGKTNSVKANNPDTISPSLLSAFPSSADTLIIYFDEPLDINSVSASDITIDNGIGNPDALFLNAAQANQIKIHLPVNLSDGILYTLTIHTIADCAGNNLNPENSTVQFGIPEPADSFDIVINEVLFNPYTNGVDFVELYNRSQKLIDLSQLQLIEYDIADSTSVSEFTVISTTGKIILPGQYIVVTSDVNNVAENYNVTDVSNFITAASTPNYPDDEGIVALEDKSFNTIDRLHYYDTWQFELLDVVDGVSLERINYDFATQDKNNWHSAAQDAGYATPGKQNSDFGAINLQQGNISLEYPVFSPDGDGYHDILIINYKNASEGFVGNFKIFDTGGRLVKELTKNETLSRQGFITWDGVDDNGNLSNMGIYILYAELFDLNGRIEKYKLDFTLARKN